MSSRLIKSLLIFVFFISFFFNLVLFRSAFYYYRLLLRLSLDPIGLKAQPSLRSQTPIGSKPRLFFLGDSRSKSWPPPRFPHDYVFVNLGVSGQTTSQVLARYRHSPIPVSKQDTFVIQAGINDLKAIPIFPLLRNQIVTSCINNISELTSFIQQQGADVVLTTIFPPGHIPLLRRPFWSSDVDKAISDCNLGIKRLASRRVHILDASAILADRYGRTRSDYQLDFLHLNARGYHALNSSLKTILRNNLLSN
jgi:lysophospholipase L1-like esterase